MKDWTPLREAPKILADPPNIYNMKTSEIKDMMTRVQNVADAGSQFPFLGNVNMTAAPDFGETITRSRVENSLRRPEIKEDPDRLFFKTNKAGVDEDDKRKMYDFNVVSKHTEGPVDHAQERSLPVDIEDYQDNVSKTSQSSLVYEITEESSNLTPDYEAEDVIPLYLHIPKRAGCPKFCISINVEITRTGRQINTECRKTLVCKTNSK